MVGWGKIKEKKIVENGYQSIGEGMFGRHEGDFETESLSCSF